MMEATFLIAIIVVLLLWSAFFSGSEAAFFSIPSTRLKSYQTDRDSKKRLIALLLSQPHDLLVTVFILNTLVNILLQNTAANLFGDFSSWALKVGVPLILTLILGEIIPKYIGLQRNYAIVYRVAPLIDILHRMLKPIRQITIAITVPISQTLFFFLKKAEKISPEELEHVLKTSKEQGILSSDEEVLVSGYLRLQEGEVRELMRPREDILYYNIAEPLSKLYDLFMDQKRTRVPVCDPDLDRVLGEISAKHCLLHREQIKNSYDLLSLLARPFYVPETTSTRLLLRRFQQNGRTMALVVDEYGALTGLITQTDLLEEVIGKMSDVQEEQSLFTRSGKDEIIASGKLELEEFNEIFGVELISPNNMITIGGWLMERLGEIPENGSKHALDGFLFQVLEASPNRIRLLYIRKIGSRR